MNNFPQNEQERAIELLGQKLELFGSFREQTQTQTELLAADDMDGFERAIDARQETIEKINGLHQELDVLMQSYVSFTTDGGEKIDAIEKAVGEIDSLIRECIEMNDNNTALAKEKTEEYIKQIGDLSVRRKSLGKYTLSVPNNPELFDKTT